MKGTKDQKRFTERNQGLGKEYRKGLPDYERYTERN